MILGLCSCCSGWTINPTGEKCPYCFNRVAPLKPLALTEVPDGSRINVHGDVFGPDGTKLVSMQQSEDKETVKYLRGLVRQWDEGQATDYGIAFELFQKHIEELLTIGEPGEKIHTITAGSFRNVPRTVRTVTVRIERSNFGEIEVTRLE